MPLAAGGAGAAACAVDPSGDDDSPSAVPSATASSCVDVALKAGRGAAAKGECRRQGPVAAVAWPCRMLPAVLLPALAALAAAAAAAAARLDRLLPLLPALLLALLRLLLLLSNVDAAAAKGEAEGEATAANGEGILLGGTAGAGVAAAAGPVAACMAADGCGHVHNPLVDVAAALLLLSPPTAPAAAAKGDAGFHGPVVPAAAAAVPVEGGGGAGDCDRICAAAAAANGEANLT